MIDTEMRSSALVSLARFDRADQLAVACSILDNAGIEYSIRNEYMPSILPVGEDLAAEIMVHEEQAARAAKLLHKLIEGE